ncbi:Uma2 family endonuclease [Streptomyces sp. NPDC058694]|uniref:Uma2 family endonuclease n=1 Tax=Streptomyces sp. NPDC058694 TaxID=3346603 RepID=UPI003668A7F6
MNTLTGDYLLTDDDWEELVWVWRQTDVPKGCRVEIIDGLIMVTHYSANAHHVVASGVHRSLCEAISEDRGVYQRLAVADPRHLGLYVPDLAVVPEEALLSGDDSFVPASAAELVVEITSKATSDNDRVKKVVAYAQAGVPLYLLIDSLAPGGPTVTAYGEPTDDVYRVLHGGRFGDPVALPQPFDLTLDTSKFPVG